MDRMDIDLNVLIEKEPPAPSKTWSDQPDAVDGLPILFDGRVNGEHSQIRKDKLGRYYLTVGNLFGSETRFFDAVDDLLETLNLRAR